jgi:hypothetical protein
MEEVTREMIAYVRRDRIGVAIGDGSNGIFDLSAKRRSDGGFARRL